MKKIWLGVWLCIVVYLPGSAKEQTMNYYGVVLAGGIGERLWPLSRRDNPKQFLSVDAHKTLLEQAIDRLQPVICPENIWVTISAQHASQVKGIDSIIVEPINRNTGPAILYSCFELYKKNPDAIVLFVPADPYIPTTDYDTFTECIQTALEFVSQHDVIALLGVKPTCAASGYGYIEYNVEHHNNEFYQVERFHEKPSKKLASFYMQMPHMLWNSGMFVAKVSVFIDEFERVAPELYGEMIAWQQGEKTYHEISDISIDYAVMERSNRIWVLPVDFSWCDVGNLEVYLSIKNSLQKNNSRLVSIDSYNNLVDVPNKIVALVGIDDLCIVETADALLITKRSEAEKVRSVVTKLKKTHQDSYL